MSTPIPERAATGTPAKAKSRVIRNVITNWGAYVISMGVNFLLSPFLVRHLGNEGYGVWTLILSLTGYLGLLDLGVRGAVTRYVAKFHTEADHEKASHAASSAMVIFSTAGLIAILVSVLLAVFVVGRMQIPGNYMTAARIVMLITGLSLATSLVNGVYGGVLVGMQRFDLTNSVEIVINILRAGVIVAALYSGSGLVTLAIIQLACTIARWLANVALTRRLYPELRIHFSQADWAGVKLIFSFSLFSFLLHVSGSLIYASDAVVIGFYLPVTAVTFYVIGGNLVEYTRTVVGGISGTMTPLASSTEALKNHERLQEIVLFSSRAGSMVVLPIALTFILRGSAFIGLWMGSRYADLSGSVLRILSFTLIFWAANSVTAGSLLGLSKHKPIVPMLLSEGICNLALSILWVRGSLGILGVAWGTLVPSLVSSLIFWPWYIRRSIGIEPVKYAISAWVRPGIGVLPYALATQTIEHYWPATNLVVFFLQVALVLPLALVGYWLVCLDRPQRQEYSQVFVRSMDRVFARVS